MQCNTLTHSSNLQSGLGHLEMIEISLQPRCDDGTLPNNSKTSMWWAKIEQYADMNKIHLLLNLEETKRELKRMGMVDFDIQTRPLWIGRDNYVCEQCLDRYGWMKRPQGVDCRYCQPWPNDPGDPNKEFPAEHYKLLYLRAVDTLSRALFTQSNPDFDKPWQDFFKEVIEELKNPKCHAYNEMSVDPHGDWVSDANR